MFDFGSRLSPGLIDLANQATQQAALAKRFVGAAANGNRPDNLATFVLRAFFDTGIARVGTDIRLFAAQQCVDLGDIGHVGRRTDHAVHQPRVVIDTDMRLHTEAVLVASLGLAPLRITLAVLVLG